MADNSLIVLPDVGVTWTAPAALPVTYWLDPNLNYLRDEYGSIIVTETGEPIVVA